MAPGYVARCVRHVNNTGEPCRTFISRMYGKVEQEIHLNALMDWFDTWDSQ